MRLLLDSNVIVAAFATRGICGAVFEYCIENHEVVVSPEILGEVEQALVRKVRAPRAVAKDIVEYLRSETEEVSAVHIPKSACRDSNDLPVLGAAVAGRCKYIISGDADLQSIRGYRGIKIVSPRAFWQEMKRG